MKPIWRKTRHIAFSIVTLLLVAIGPGYAIVVGDRVEVVGTGAQGLNIRSGAGISYDPIGGVWDGATGRTVDGPILSDGYTWWRVDWDDASAPTGWSVATCLQVIGNSPGAFTLSNESPVWDTDPPAGPAVRLNWTASSGATNYQVYRNGAAIESPTAGLTFYNSLNLSLGQTYTYFVRAINTYGTRDSNTINVYIPTTLQPGTPPSTPSLTSAFGTSGSIQITWTNVNDETGYKIQRSTSPSSGFVQVGTAGVNVTVWEDASANAGTIYYYRVIAYNSWGESPPSNVRGAVRLSQPTLSQPLNGATLTTDTVSLQWYSVAGATSYVVNIGTFAGGTDIRNGEQVTNTDHSITLASGTYYWRVYAQNTTYAGMSVESVEWRFNVNTTAPCIRINPTSLTVTNP